MVFFSEKNKRKNLIPIPLVVEASDAAEILQHRAGSQSNDLSPNGNGAALKKAGCKKKRKESWL